MVKNLSKGFLPLLLIINLSCDKDIRLDLPPTDIRPVVFGMAQTDKPVDLIVYKSYPLLEYTDTLDQNIVTDISLFVNGNFQEILTYRNKHYYSSYLPKTQDNLKISFNWQSIEISAESIIPNKIKIDSILFVKRTFDNQRVFNVYFADDIRFKNYYAITADYNYIEYTENKNAYLTTTSSSPLVGNEEDMSNYYDYQSLLFSDALFNGLSLNLNINIYAPYLNEDEAFVGVKLYLSNITEDYYNYVKTFLKNQRAQTPSFFFGDLEYINVHSNIKNGYGLFKTFSLDSVDISQPLRNK